MSLIDKFNRSPFSDKGWEEKILEADALWAQVKTLLSENNLGLPSTPRRPDVRMIVNNISGAEIRFKNPGDHSGSKEEVIPGIGDKCAIMIMVAGATLDEQQKNAETLYNLYDLGVNGISQNFLDDLKAGNLVHLISEAYGPAPYLGQAEKLVPVEWEREDGSISKILPQTGAAAAYGARAATYETVFLAKFNIFIKGSTTTPELVESSGMAIAVAEDYKTKAETTRPIVPSVAKTYYGAHFDGIPEVTVHPDGIVNAIRFKNGNAPNATSQNKPPAPK